MAQKANWNYPTAVRFGAGRIKELPDACKASGMSRPLLVTDPGLAGLPFVKAALDSLTGAGLGAAVYSRIRSDPVETKVEGGVETQRGGGHRFGSWPRRRHHAGSDAHEEGHLPPEDDARDHALRSGADVGLAAAHHRGDGHGRLRALP